MVELILSSENNKIIYLGYGWVSFDLRKYQNYIYLGYKICNVIFSKKKCYFYRNYYMALFFCLRLCAWPTHATLCNTTM